MDLKNIKADKLMMYYKTWFDTYKDKYIETRDIEEAPDWMMQYFVMMDTDVNLEYSEARRNYCRLRGKPVTPEQALDVIRRTDLLFRRGRFNVINNDWNDYVGTYNICNDWFGTHPIHNEYYGWMYPDGTVGSNFITEKYPAPIEFISEMAWLLKAFPYLDMVLAVTNWDEIPEYVWNYMDDCYKDEDCEELTVSKEEYNKKCKEQSEIIRTEDYKGFYDNLWFGVWVHDGTIEILNSNNAAEKFKEYEELYGVEDKLVYTHGYYGDKGESPCDKEYKQRCMDIYKEKYESTAEGKLHKVINQCFDEII